MNKIRFRQLYRFILLCIVFIGKNSSVVESGPAESNLYKGMKNIICLLYTEKSLCPKSDKDSLL